MILRLPAKSNRKIVPPAMTKVVQTDTPGMALKTGINPPTHDLRDAGMRF